MNSILSSTSASGSSSSSRCRRRRSASFASSLVDSTSSPMSVVERQRRARRRCRRRSWADCRRRHRSSMLVASTDSCASPSSPSPRCRATCAVACLTAAGTSGVNSIGLTPVDQSRYWTFRLRTLDASTIRTAFGTVSTTHACRRSALTSASTSELVASVEWILRRGTFRTAL
jgi:hypothetical protein